MESALYSFVILIYLSPFLAAFPSPPENSHHVGSYLSETPKLYETFSSDPVCTEDCTGLKFVKGGQEYYVHCKTQTGTKQYCNKLTNQCDKEVQHCLTPDPACDTVDGFYPNVTDCTKFYYCDNSYKIDYECDGESVYNPKSEQCEFNVECYSFAPDKKCKGKIGSMVNHPLIKNFFVYCGSQPVLFQCSVKEFKFNTATGNCEFICTEAGRFPDNREGMEAWYYECIKDGVGWISTHKSCPDGTIFDPTASACKHKEMK